MKSILLRSILLLFIFIISCSCSRSKNDDNGNVGFMVADYYFVKNTYTGETNPSYLLIRSYSSFVSIFGVGAVMNMDTSKLITEDKMKSGFVMSVIYQGNDIHAFGIEKIILKNGQLQVYYTSEVTAPNADWQCNCHVTILIDNCDFSSVLLFENGSPLPDAVIKEL